jgi:phosphate:Na+ symporter
MELLINIVGGVALLIWGVRMVHTGLNRSLGGTLRRVVSKSAGNRASAFAVGLGITGLLQSSTATALIAASFAGRGLITTAMGLALMLGADVGSTLIVQAMSFNLSWLSPAMIAVGVALFLTSSNSTRRGLSRAAIGLGLILLSLTLISKASIPLRETEGLSVVLGALSDELILAVLVMAAVTWFAHSSVAIVLLIMSFAAVEAIGVPLAMAMVLGANLGGAVIAFVSTSGSVVAARRIPLGNLIMRAAGVLIALPVLAWIEPHLIAFDPDPARLVANFHTAFNLGLSVVFLPFVGLLATVTTRVLPEKAGVDDPGAPRYLDTDALDTPAIALSSAARETLRMGDEVKVMLEQTKQVFLTNNADLMREVEERDDIVDQLHEAIKLYLTSMTRHELDDQESRRSIEILSFTTNLEHIGDVVDKNLMELANKKIKNKSAFSDEGQAEIAAFHDRVIGNFDLALNIFMTPDLPLARKLLREKTEIRDLEREFTERHFARISQGRAVSIDSSSVHLDILRDLKRINSHLTSVAYPILERYGELAESRLLEREAKTRVPGEIGPTE